MITLYFTNVLFSVMRSTFWLTFLFIDFTEHKKNLLSDVWRMDQVHGIPALLIKIDQIIVLHTVP